MYLINQFQMGMRMRDCHAFLKSIESEAAECKRRQQAAFEGERERWASAAAGVAQGAAR
jgi:hypothetical protein